MTHPRKSSAKVTGARHITHTPLSFSLPFYSPSLFSAATIPRIRSCSLDDTNCGTLSICSGTEVTSTQRFPMKGHGTTRTHTHTHVCAGRPSSPYLWRHPPSTCEQRLRPSRFQCSPNQTSGLLCYPRGAAVHLIKRPAAPAAQNFL